MPDQATTRPGLAILSNSVAPYHVSLHSAIAAGIPEMQVHLMVSHGSADFDWKVDVPPTIKVARFGAAGESPLDNPLRRPIHGSRKGGRMIGFVRDNNIRAVIINGYRFISFLRLMNYCYRSGIPFFVNSDSNIRNEPKLSPVAKFAKRAIYAWWMKRVSGVLSMGTLGDQFFMKYGADPARIYRVPCWPDFDSFSRVDEIQLERFRQKFRLNGHRRYLLYSGRLVSYKRVDLLIDAFAAIAAQRPDWDLLVVGDGVHRSDLEQRVRPDLRNRVVWTGFLDGSEPATAYHAADVLVLPSDHEPWALVVQEAMAAGLPVVSSDVPGASFDLVEDGRSGRIFPKGDLDQLKSALLDVTATGALSNYKRESAEALAKWRDKVNPVTEIRRALVDVGVLNLQPNSTNELRVPTPSLRR